VALVSLRPISQGGQEERERPSANPGSHRRQKAPRTDSRRRGACADHHGEDLLECRRVRREFKAACRAAKLGEQWTPRELRHSFVSLMSSSGVPVEEIARLAGHSNTRTTAADGWCRNHVRPPSVWWWSGAVRVAADVIS
jgi:integrase